MSNYERQLNVMAAELNLIESNKEYLRELFKALKKISDPFIHGGPLSRAENEFVWQFVRLNKLYQKEYDQFVSDDLREKDRDEADQLRKDFCSKFIISEPVPYTEFIFPQAVHFYPIAIKASSVFFANKSSSVGYAKIESMKREMLLHPGNLGFIVAMINPLTNRQHIHSEIDKSIKKHLEELKRRSELVKKGSFQYATDRRGHELTIEKLMTALICYLSFKTGSLWKEDTKKMSKLRAVNQMIEDILQKSKSSQNGASIKEGISKFHNLSLHSPHVFFCARKA